MRILKFASVLIVLLLLDEAVIRRTGDDGTTKRDGSYQKAKFQMIGT
jgi:hypothetical protein